MGKSLPDTRLEGQKLAIMRCLCRTTAARNARAGTDRTPMNTDTLRAELERLFELDELLRLTSDILELDPTHIGSTTTLASFAHALVDYCAREHTLLALSDVVAVYKPDASPELSTQAMDGASLLPELCPGDLWEGFVIVRKLGSGPWGTSYLATQGDGEVRLKVVPDGAIQGRAAL